MNGYEYVLSLEKRLHRLRLNRLQTIVPECTETMTDHQRQQGSFTRYFGGPQLTQRHLSHLVINDRSYEYWRLDFGWLKAHWST